MKRKRSAKQQAAADAIATKRAATATEVALGPIPTLLLLFGTSARSHACARVEGRGVD
jgi:hypothetical protein